MYKYARLAACTSFKNVCNNFLGNQKSENYPGVVAMLESYKNVNKNSLFRFTFRFFPFNLEKVSDEQV